MAIRILAIFILLLSVLFWPYYISLILGIIFLIYFRLFWEAPVLFLISDLLFGVSTPHLFGFTYLFFLIGILSLYAIENLKRELRFYPKID
jgi:hypothetical protein